MKYIMITLVAVAIMAVSATAEERTTSVSGWQVGPYLKDDGSFMHCGSSMIMDNDVAIIFVASIEHGITIRFGSPGWVLKKDANYPVSLGLDSGAPMNLTAFAVDTDLVDIPLPRTYDYFDKLRHGRILSVGTERGVFRYDLSGTMEMLDSLMICVKKNSKRNGMF